MPTYVYKCPKCESIREEFHWMNQKPEFKCTECDAVMQRQITGCGLVFKGSGFYATDYKHRSEHHRDVVNKVKKIQKGDQDTINNLYSDAKKVKAENQKQQAIKSGKNKPIKRSNP